MVHGRIAAKPGFASEVVILMEAGLFIQFLIGMYTNLFVRLPVVSSPIGMGGWMSDMGSMMSQSARSPIFMIHMILGILLVIGAVAAIAVSAVNGRAILTVWSGLGLTAILVAGYGGLAFFLGGHHNGNSYTMAVGWLVAFIAYFMGLREPAR